MVQSSTDAWHIVCSVHRLDRLLSVADLPTLILLFSTLLLTGHLSSAHGYTVVAVGIILCNTVALDL